jgi:hypothetical protein
MKINFTHEPSADVLYGNSLMNGLRKHQVYPRGVVLTLCNFGRGHSIQGRHPERGLMAFLI